MERKVKRQPSVFEMLPDGRAVAPNYGNLEKRNDEYGLCNSCMLSKWSCKNTYNREVRVPMEKDDLREEEIVTTRLKGWRVNEIISKPTGFKLVDGVEAGIYTSSDDIPQASKCGWYEPNSGDIPSR